MKSKEVLKINKFFQCDLNNGIPVKNKSYDTVLAMEVIEHLEDPKAFIRELTRVARKKVIITCPLKNAFPHKQHIWEFDEKDFVSCFNEVGCEIRVVKDKIDYLLVIYYL